MPKRVADTGPALVSGSHTNVKATIDGKLTLADTNLLPDPTFADLDSSGVLGGCEFASPPRMVARNLYVKGPSDSDHRLIASRVVASRYSYLFDGSTSAAIFPPASTNRPDLPIPPPPVLAAIVSGSFGLATGYLDFAYSIVTGSLYGEDRRLTAPSPRAQAHVTVAGQQVSASATLDTAVAAGAVGIAWYATAVQASSGAATSATLTLQEIVPLDSAALTRVFTGPIRVGEAVTSNETYNGAFEDYAGPEWEYVSVPGATLEPMHLELSWSYATAFGRSASQAIEPSASYIDVVGGEGMGLAAKPPDKPPGGLSWRLEWRSTGGTGTGLWYSYSDSQDFDSWQYVYSADPASGVPGASLMQAVARATTDASGVATPDDAPTLTVLAPPTTVSGAYSVKTTGVYEEGNILTESAPSTAASTSLATNGALQIKMPGPGNLFPGFDQRTYAGLVEGWSYPTGVTNLSHAFAAGVATVTDTTGSATNVDVLYASAGVDHAKPYTLRLKVDVTQSSGAVKVLLRQLDGSSSVLAEHTLLTTTSGADLALSEFTIATSGGDYTMNSSTVSLQLAVRHEGSTTTRNATSVLSQVGLFEGYAVPFKRTLAALSPDAEGTAEPYPSGGYVAVIENPTSRHADLTGIATNALEYHGPNGTTLAAARFFKGLRLPVRQGQDYAMSFYADSRGVESGTEILASAFKDVDGRTIQVNDAIASLSGTSAWTRYQDTWQAPADAAYLEITGSVVGRGRVRVMGLQFEKGTVATAFDPGDLPLSGEAIITMDAAATNVLSGPLRPLGEVTGITDLQVIGDAEDGELDYEFRSGEDLETIDGETWLTDPEDLVVDHVRHYLQVKVTLTA